MRVLVTGAGGMVGGRLATLLSPGHQVVAAHHVSPPPPDLPTVSLDLTSTSSLDQALARVDPEAVVHCAALADADRCEREPEAAVQLNLRAAAALAQRCRQSGVRLIALSTDLVFGGDRAMVDEATPAYPLSEYGRTKLMGEEAVLAEAPGSAVVRVALICGRGFGPRGSASESIVWAFHAGQRLRLFTDQYRTPIDAGSIATAIGRLLEGSEAGRFHLGGPDRLSRYQLGLRVAKCLGFAAERIEAATQDQAEGCARRPADVSFDSSRARRELGWQPRPLDQAILEGRPVPDIIAMSRG